MVFFYTLALTRSFSALSEGAQIVLFGRGIFTVRIWAIFTRNDEEAVGSHDSVSRAGRGTNLGPGVLPCLNGRSAARLAHHPARSYRLCDTMNGGCRLLTQADGKIEQPEEIKVRLWQQQLRSVQCMCDMEYRAWAAPADDSAPPAATRAPLASTAAAEAIDPYAFRVDDDDDDEEDNGGRGERTTDRGGVDRHRPPVRHNVGLLCDDHGKSLAVLALVASQGHACSRSARTAVVRRELWGQRGLCPDVARLVLSYSADRPVTPALLAAELNSGGGGAVKAQRQRLFRDAPPRFAQWTVDDPRGRERRPDDDRRPALFLDATLVVVPHVQMRDWSLQVQRDTSLATAAVVQTERQCRNLLDRAERSAREWWQATVQLRRPHSTLENGGDGGGGGGAQELQQAAVLAAWQHATEPGQVVALLPCGQQQQQRLATAGASRKRKRPSPSSPPVQGPGHALIVCNANRFGLLAQETALRGIGWSRIVIEEVTDIRLSDASGAVPLYRFLWGVTSTPDRLRGMAPKNGSLLGVFRHLAPADLAVVAIRNDPAQRCPRAALDGLPPYLVLPLRCARDQLQATVEHLATEVAAAHTADSARLRPAAAAVAAGTALPKDLLETCLYASREAFRGWLRTALGVAGAQRRLERADAATAAARAARAHPLSPVTDGGTTAAAAVAAGYPRTVAEREEARDRATVQQDARSSDAGRVELLLSRQGLYGLAARFRYLLAAHGVCGGRVPGTDGTDCATRLSQTDRVFRRPGGLVVCPACAADECAATGGPFGDYALAVRSFPSLADGRASIVSDVPSSSSGSWWSPVRWEGSPGRAPPRALTAEESAGLCGRLRAAATLTGQQPPRYVLAAPDPGLLSTLGGGHRNECLRALLCRFRDEKQPCVVYAARGRRQAAQVLGAVEFRTLKGAAGTVAAALDKLRRGNLHAVLIDDRRRVAGTDLGFVNRIVLCEDPGADLFGKLVGRAQRPGRDPRQPRLEVYLLF